MELTARHDGWRALADDAGMTLLEVLVVMVILGLIATLGISQVMGYLGNAKQDAARLQIRELVADVELFSVDVGRVPTNDEGLNVLYENTAKIDKWRGPYIQRKANLVDPWGHAFAYKAPGSHGDFDIVSYGADAQAGGTGEGADVNSWDDH